jgi:hypothetical protein
MQVQIPHNTTKDQAIERIKKLIKDSQEKIKEQAGSVEAVWQDNVLNFEFTAQGQQSFRSRCAFSKAPSSA